LLLFIWGASPHLINCPPGLQDRLRFLKPSRLVLKYLGVTFTPSNTCSNVAANVADLARMMLLGPIWDPKKTAAPNGTNEVHLKQAIAPSDYFFMTGAKMLVLFFIV